MKVPLTNFMGAIIACVIAADYDQIVVKELADRLEQIAIERPDLVKRYDKALATRDAGEIERLWFQCQLILKSWGNLRINAITGRLHIGHSSRSYPLFPRIFQVWPSVRNQAGARNLNTFEDCAVKHQWASDVTFDGVRLEVLSDNGDVLFDLSVPDKGQMTVNTFGNEVAATLIEAAIEVVRQR
jgi:hypothetical protein